MSGVAEKLSLGRTTPQDATVATADIIPALSDKTSKVPSRRGILPVHGRDGPKVTTEDDTGNLTPRCAVTKPVQDSQHENEAMAMKC